MSKTAKFKILKSHDNPNGFELFELLYQIQQEIILDATQVCDVVSHHERITAAQAREETNRGRILFLLEMAEKHARGEMNNANNSSINKAAIKLN